MPVALLYLLRPAALAFALVFGFLVHLHVMVQGTEGWLRHLAFRDCLKAHPDLRFADAALKLQIAEREFDKPLHYDAHKDEFIRSVRPRP